MTHQHTIVSAVFSAALFIMCTSPTAASDVTLNKVVDGVSIHMGIVHCNQLQQHKQQKIKLVKYLGDKMRGRKHHVTVALFDTATGQRISDARVKVVVGEFGLGGKTKKLSTEEYAGAVTYAGEFVLANKGPFWIDLNIRRDNSKHVTKTRFEWEHF